jgi:hypothetical protein
MDQRLRFVVFLVVFRFAAVRFFTPDFTLPWPADRLTTASSWRWRAPTIRPSASADFNINDGSLSDDAEPPLFRLAIQASCGYLPAAGGHYSLTEEIYQGPCQVAR